MRGSRGCSRRRVSTEERTRGKLLQRPRAAIVLLDSPLDFQRMPTADHPLLSSEGCDHHPSTLCQSQRDCKIGNENESRWENERRIGICLGHDEGEFWNDCGTGWASSCVIESENESSFHCEIVIESGNSFHCENESNCHCGIDCNCAIEIGSESGHCHRKSRRWSEKRKRSSGRQEGECSAQSRFPFPQSPCAASWARRFSRPFLAPLLSTRGSRCTLLPSGQQSARSIQGPIFPSLCKESGPQGRASQRKRDAWRRGGGQSQDG
mmetsp:Transcript_53337/g.88614  ORF Transcript_53337/g.88614 Transcript_53337/m.88614 type:complete len:266 (+) Transcript_53337:779-1576(+)